MVNIERLEDWRGQQVFDRAGESLGKLDEIYYDAGSGKPVLIAVKSGLLGRKSSLIPVEGATAGRDYLHVAHDKATIEAAGDIGSGGNPTREELASIGNAYGARFADSQLQSATEIDARRAEAEAARQRAAEAAEEEQARLAERDLAAERAQQASAEAASADEAADQAHRAAENARREAQRHHRE